MKKAIIAVFVLALLAHSAYALTGYIQPAKMILRPNITSGIVNMINSSIELKNMNNIPVVVGLSLDGLNGELQEDNISLNLNEVKEVGFTIFLTNEGNYTGSISALYRDGQGLPISVSCEILVYATANGTYANNHAPSEPNLISPLNNSSGNETSITFKWSASTDADGDTIAYNYQLSNNGNFSNPGIQGATFGTEKTVNVGHGKWYWRVIADDGMHNSSSDVWQLLINNPPYTPKLLNPLNQSTLNEKPILNWTGGDLDSDVVTYDLVVGDYNFTSPVINKVVTNSFYDTSSDNLQNQAYCWKVRSNDGFVESDFSSVSCFTLNMSQNQAPQPSCSDGIQNQGETGIDCGGPCSACPSSSSGSGGGGNGGSTSGNSDGSTPGSSGSNYTTTNTTSTITNTTTNTTSTAEQENTTEEQNKTSQPEKPTGFVFAVPTQYWVLVLILVAGALGFYIFYKYREDHSDYNWEQRLKV